MPDRFALGYVDGRVLPLDEARVPLADRGFLLGDGVFETLRASGGRVFRWDLHAARLRHGLATTGIHEGAVEAARVAVDRLVETAVKEATGPLYIRVQVTRDRTVKEPRDAVGEVTALARPLVAYPDAVYRDGVAVAVAPWRKDPADPLSSVKHLSYLPYLMARRDAQRRGFDDAIILNTAGRPCEASHSNLVAVVDDALHAPGPAEGALDGVTRHVVLDSARAQGFRIRESITEHDLAEAGELLLLNTIGGVVPVRQIHGLRADALGKPGPVARRLHKAYHASLEAAAAAPSV